LLNFGVKPGCLLIHAHPGEPTKNATCQLKSQAGRLIIRLFIRLFIRVIKRWVFASIRLLISRPAQTIY